jgi:hypothetical protein
MTYLSLNGTYVFSCAMQRFGSLSLIYEFIFFYLFFSVGRDEEPARPPGTNVQPDRGGPGPEPPQDSQVVLFVDDQHHRQRASPRLTREE